MTHGSVVDLRRPAKPWVWWRGVEALCHIEVGGVRTGAISEGAATARDDCSGHHLEEHHNVRPYFLEREIVPQAAEQVPPQYLPGVESLETLQLMSIFGDIGSFFQGAANDVENIGQQAVSDVENYGQQAIGAITSGPSRPSVPSRTTVSSSSPP